MLYPHLQGKLRYTPPVCAEIDHGAADHASVEEVRRDAIYWRFRNAYQISRDFDHLDRWQIAPSSQ